MKTILYIDNSEIHRLLLQAELSQEGIHVVTAGSIEEALSKWKELNPGFVILWREYATRGCPYREMMGSQKYCVLTIN